jgi:CysZ protein
MYPLTKTFKSLFNAKLFRLMLLCAVVAFSLAAIIALVLTWLTANLVEIENKWFNALFTASVGILTGVGGWFMLPSLIVLVAGFFQETVIRQVEQHDYPQAAKRTALPFWSELWHDLRFTTWSLLLNVLILPFYLIGIGFVMSIVLNSYLIGREFFESAAGYHLGKAQAKALRQQYPKPVFGGGLILTLLALTPVVNLLVPLIATIWMVHVYHAIADK